MGKSIQVQYLVAIDHFSGILIERKARIHDQGSAMSRNHSRQRVRAEDYPHSKSGDNGSSRTHEIVKHVISLRSFLLDVVDRLDGCTRLCTACGSHDDVLHSSPSREAHFSSKLQALQVTTAVEDVKEFAVCGTFTNDGTFPVSDEELQDARYHSLDDKSDISVARYLPPPEALRRHPAMWSDRGLSREYYDRDAEETDLSCSTQCSSSPRRSRRHSRSRYGPQQVHCHIITTKQTAAGRE